MDTIPPLYRDHGVFCVGNDDTFDATGESAEREAMDYLIDNLRNHASAGKFRILANYNIPTNLKGMSGRLEVDLLLICKMGVFLLEVKNWTGQIDGYESSWVLNGGIERRPDPIGKGERKARALFGILFSANSYFPQLNQVSITSLVILTKDDTYRDYRHKHSTPAHVVNKLHSDLIRRLTSTEILFRRDGSRELSNSEIEYIFTKLYKEYRPAEIKHIGNYEIIDSLPLGELYDAAFWGKHSWTDVQRRIKRFTIPRISRSEKALNHFKQNARALSKIGSHPNILQFVDFFPDGDQEYVYYEVTEMPNGKRLDELLQDAGTDGKAISFDNQNLIVSQLAQALQFVHDKNVVHRNLNPECIYVSEPDFNVKIGDFDFAKVQGINSISEIMSAVETGESLGDKRNTRTLVDNFCTAPELLQSSLSATAKSDVYSLGVCWYLLAQTAIANSEYMRKTELHPNIERLGEFKLPDEAANLLRTMLSIAADNRPTLNQVITELKAIKQKQ